MGSLQFNLEQAALFFEAARGDRWALLLAFLAVTGLRIGEALALTWDDYQETPEVPGVFFVSVTKTRSEFEGKAYTNEPKTAAGMRKAYLGADAVAIIEEMQWRVKVEALAHGQGVGPYIFPSVDGRPMRQDTARAVMRRICEGANVPKLSPHALRHTFASLMHSKGHGVADLSAHLGHAQISTTLNIYRTVFDFERRGMTLNLSTAKEGGLPRIEASPVQRMRKRRRKGGPRKAARR